jgi:hypothetical protein
VSSQSGPNPIPFPKTEQSGQFRELTYPKKAYMTSQILVSFRRRKRNHPRFLVVAFLFTSLLLALSVGSSTGHCDQPPVITQHPASVVAETGDDVEFTVVTEEITDDLEYQWYKNGVAMPWYNEPTMTLPQVTAFHAGTYSVTVANSAGTVTSTGATLTINCGSFQNGGFEDGANYWYRPFGSYAGIRNSPLTPPEGDHYIGLARTGEGVTGEIQQTVCVTAGSWYKLAFQYGTDIDPNDPTYIGSRNAVMVRVYASGQIVASQSYERISPNVDFAPENLEFQVPSGVTRVTLAFWTLSDGTDPLGDPLLDDISFNVITPPTITQQPASVVADTGDDVEFTVVATGTDLEYQWYKNGVALSWRTEATLTLPQVTAFDGAAIYTVTVGNATGAVTSDGATLTLNCGTLQNGGFEDGANYWFRPFGSYAGIRNSPLTPPQGQHYIGLARTGEGVTGEIQQTVCVTPGGWYKLAFQYGTDIDPNDPTYIGSRNAVMVRVYASGQVVASQSYERISPNVGFAPESLTFQVPSGVSMVTLAFWTLSDGTDPLGDPLLDDISFNLAPPTITQQPASVVADTGDDVEFTVVATGTDLEYQWYKNGVAMSWRTEPTLTLPQVTAFDAATYTVTVANSGGTVTSTGATLTINCGSLQNGNFEELLDHWYTPFPGYAGLRNSPLPPPEGDSYVGLARTGEGVIGTIQQTVCVTPGNWYKLAFQYGTDIDPNDPTYIGSRNAVMVQVIASGQVVASQQYERVSPDVGFALENLEFQVPSGVSMVTLSFWTLSDGTDPLGDPLLDDISFNVITPPAITLQPSSVVADTGDGVEFTVVATGTDLEYQWYKNGVVIPWATEPTLSLWWVTLADAATYSVTVANAAGSVTSTGATLILNCGSFQNGGFEDGLNHWFTPYPGYDSVRNSPLPPPEGQYYVGLGFSGIEGIQGTVQQTVCVTPGNWYKLAFQFGSDLDPNYPEHIGNFTEVLVQVLSSGGVVATQQYQRTSPNVDFAPEYLEFQVPSGVTMVTLSFKNMSDGTAPMGDPLLDDISFNVITPPTITQQPASVVADTGDDVEFTVVATGTDLEYQWYKNGVAMPWRIEPTLTLPQVTAFDAAATYTVTVANAAGSVTSTGATLTLNCGSLQNGGFEDEANHWFRPFGDYASVRNSPLTPPEGQHYIGLARTGEGVIGTIQQTVCVTPGSWYKLAFQYGTDIDPNDPTYIGSRNAVMVQVIASGGIVASQQYERTSPDVGFAPESLEFQVPAGVTMVTLTFWTLSDGTDPLGDPLLDDISFNLAPPRITTQPSGLMRDQGQSATFTVVAVGQAPLSYQWWKNGTIISGATLSSYTIASCQGSHAGNYFVVVSNPNGSVTSGNAVLVVNLPPSITGQPQMQVVSAGANATFTVTAAGTAPLSYQWQKDQVSIAGATGSSYTRVNVQTTDTGLYSVGVYNSLDTVWSADAALRLTGFPVFSDTFELGNLNNWANYGTALVATTARNHTSGGAYSARLTNSMQKMYRNLGVELQGHVKATFWIYDGLTAQTRFFGEIRCFSGAGYPNGSLQQLFAIGRYSVAFDAGTGTIAGESVDTTRYQGRVLTGANTGWFNLNGPGAPTRSAGWHKFEIEKLANGTTVNFYVDGILSRTITSANAATWDTVIMGSIAAGSTIGDAWFDDIKVESMAPPVITTQPTSRTVSVGANTTFSVVATGNVTGYQWRLNGVNIPGATSSTLALNNVQLTDAGNYTVVVKNKVGPTTSNNATLTVQ